MQLVSGPLGVPDASLPEVPLNVDRLTLAKRLWRGRAEDGAEFGFELEKPLQHGAVFWQTATARYVIQQQPEAVVEIALEMAPSAAAGIGWAVGNLHLELQAESERLLAPDEPAVRPLGCAVYRECTRTSSPSLSVSQLGYHAHVQHLCHQSEVFG
jgi:urease accessory protein